MTFQQLEKIFAFDTQKSSCIEIQFRLLDSETFSDCWMGKTYDGNFQCDLYWFGLTPDGENVHDYLSFAKMADAPVFDGKTLKEVCGRIVIEEANGVGVLWAHQFSRGNKALLRQPQTCGCFHCLNIFDSSKITDYLAQEDTALCPFCLVDAVIGEGSRPITPAFLKEMQEYWF